MPNNIPRPSYPALAPAALAWEFGLRDYDSMHIHAYVTLREYDIHRPAEGQGIKKTTQ
jgi:hypothetical protein